MAARAVDDVRHGIVGSKGWATLHRCPNRIRRDPFSTTHGTTGALRGRTVTYAPSPRLGALAVDRSVNSAGLPGVPGAAGPRLGPSSKKASGARRSASTAPSLQTVDSRDHQTTSNRRNGADGSGLVGSKCGKQPRRTYANSGGWRIASESDFELETNRRGRLPNAPLLTLNQPARPRV